MSIGHWDSRYFDTCHEFMSLIKSYLVIFLNLFLLLISFNSGERDYSVTSFNFLTALSTAAEISLSKSIDPACVRSWNNNAYLRIAMRQVQRAHHKFGKYSYQHSDALEELIVLTPLWQRRTLWR